MLFMGICVAGTLAKIRVGVIGHSACNTGDSYIFAIKGLGFDWNFE